MTNATDDEPITSDTLFMSGTEALARLAVDQLSADRRAGHRTAALVTGYPGSPLGGYGAAAAAAAARHPELPISLRPALNEEFAATALAGSQVASTQPDSRYDGVVGIWYGKAPGIDRAADALRHGVYTGTSTLGGVVVLAGDDPTAKSSTLPSSSVGLLTDLHMPVLYPAGPRSALLLGRHAIALSRWSGLWAALKIVPDVADGTAALHHADLAFRNALPESQGAHRPPDGRVLTPATLETEHDIYTVRLERALDYAQLNGLNEITGAPDAWMGIVASGPTYAELRDALARLGLGSEEALESVGVRLLNMQMPIPFDAETARRFSEGLEEVLVIEEKQPQLEQSLIAALYRTPSPPLVTGKRDADGNSLVPLHGGLDAHEIEGVLRRRLEPRVGERIRPAQRERTIIPVAAAGSRKPFYCSGCPHNRSTEVPEGSLVGAGIGCHTMVMMMEDERVGNVVSVTPMGNEGTQWIGMSDFVERDHFIQNLGDGTYFHSGQLAVTAAIAAGVNVTFKILYNGAVAMTGGQHPEGQRSLDQLVSVLLGQGVAEVIVTTDHPEQHRSLGRRQHVAVWDRSRVVAAQDHLASVPGVTVMIHEQACAAELRRARKRGLAPTPTQRLAINHRVCEGCGDCGRVSNCLSVQPLETPFGRKTAIDQSSCNLDYSCLEGDCPSFVTVELEPSRWQRFVQRLVRRRLADDERAASAQLMLSRLLEADIPDPAPVATSREHSLRIAGIGGTGVVTVAQIIGRAAMLDGSRVAGLDQVGLSQKAGPVVSDLRISSDEPNSNRIGVGRADLLLALDPLAASLSNSLATLVPGQTVVVGSRSVTPTGEMIRHPEAEPPDVDAIIEAISAQSCPDAQHWFDLVSISNSAFGSAQSANVIAVGIAIQVGAIPVPPHRIEQAIEVNGTAVSANLNAFRLGRLLAVEPGIVDRAAEATGRALNGAGPTELHRELELLAAVRPHVHPYATELAAYQDLSLAQKYLDEVHAVHLVETQVAPGSTRLTTAVAENLYRLLAYKDEYEVARLLLDASGQSEISKVAIKGSVIRYNLHPPVLRSLGWERKVSAGAWIEPALRLLAYGRLLRGTRLDPFGSTKVRRAERNLISTYRNALDQLRAGLSEDNLDLAVQIACLPNEVRGYEDLKMERISQFDRRLEALLSEWQTTP